MDKGIALADISLEHAATRGGWRLAHLTVTARQFLAAPRASADAGEPAARAGRAAAIEAFDVAVYDDGEKLLDIRAGDLVTATLAVSQPRGATADADDEAVLFLGNHDADELLAVRVAPRRESATQQLQVKFRAPSRPGRYALSASLRARSLQGCDTARALQYTVSKQLDE